MKEQFISDLKSALLQKIDVSLINDVIDAVVVVLADYDLTKIVRDVVRYDNIDAAIIGRFFVAKAVENLSQNSLKYYKIILSKSFKSIGKHIKDIQTDDVRLYLAKLKMNNCKSATLNNERRVLSSFFAWCAAEGIVENNIMLRITGVRCEKKIRKALTEDDLKNAHEKYVF